MKATCAVVLALLATGCGSASPPEASPTPVAPTPAPVAPAPVAPAPAAITARVLFCSFGGVGIVPSPLPPGYETQFVETAFEVINPGPPRSGVALTGASLRDPSGAVSASLRRIDHFVDLTHAPPPPADWGTWAIYMNPTGTPFTGALPTGRSVLRVRYSTSPAAGAYPDHCRLELGGLGATPLVIEAASDGEWPTS